MSLNISNNQFGHECAELFVKTFYKTNIIELNIAGIGLTDKGLYEVIEMFRFLIFYSNLFSFVLIDLNLSFEIN